MISVDSDDDEEDGEDDNDTADVNVGTGSKFFKPSTTTTRSKTGQVDLRKLNRDRRKEKNKAANRLNRQLQEAEAMGDMDVVNLQDEPYDFRTDFYN